MVYHNKVTMHPANPDYGNETWRANKGYKEEHAHDAPYRRNRDFKPVGYGSYRGILNYRHSEPYCLLKNMKDLPREDHHWPTRYAKSIFKGMLIGGLSGFTYWTGSNVGQFEMSKLMAATG